MKTKEFWQSIHYELRIPSTLAMTALLSFAACDAVETGTEPIEQTDLNHRVQALSPGEIPWWVTGDEASVISWLNSERNWYGQPSLIIDPALTEKARAQASALAACGCLFHQDLTPLYAVGWTSLGENVGSAGSLWDAHVALSFSPPHLANIIGPQFKGLGIGLAWANGTFYVAEVFGGF